MEYEFRKTIEANNEDEAYEEFAALIVRIARKLEKIGVK